MSRPLALAGLEPLTIADDALFVNVGERTNVTGSKAFARLILAGDYAAGLAVASLWLAPMLLAALAIVPLIALYWRRRLGGMTGDCHGASVEVTETLLLALLAVQHG